MEALQLRLSQTSTFTVIMLHELKEELEEGVRRVDMIVRKQRRGGLDTVPMKRIGKYSRLEEL